jgi:hypothetical protein
MSLLSASEQAEQDRINNSVQYARGLGYLDKVDALALAAQLPSQAQLRQRHRHVLELASVSGRTSHVEDAMRRARDELEDAAVGRLAESCEAGDDGPPFWGLDGDLEALLVLSVRVHAGSLIVDDLLAPR